jgi:hypothetical protein
MGRNITNTYINVNSARSVKYNVSKLTSFTQKKMLPRERCLDKLNNRGRNRTNERNRLALQVDVAVDQRRTVTQAAPQATRQNVWLRCGRGNRQDRTESGLSLCRETENQSVWMANHLETHGELHLTSKLAGYRRIPESQLWARVWQSKPVIQAVSFLTDNLLTTNYAEIDVPIAYSLYRSLDSEKSWLLIRVVSWRGPTFDSANALYLNERLFAKIVERRREMVVVFSIRRRYELPTGHCRGG